MKEGRCDSLSPLSFVLAADFLETLLNKTKEEGRFNLPIPRVGSYFPLIVQYTNDILIVMEGWQSQLFLKAVLNTFAVSTVLVSISMLQRTG